MLLHFILIFSFAHAEIADDFFDLSGLKLNRSDQKYWGLANHLTENPNYDLKPLYQQLNIEKAKNDDELKTYYFQMIANEIYYQKKLKQNLDRSPSSALKNCSNAVPISMPLISFKPGDLYLKCDAVIEKAINVNAKSITWFDAIHYSGGNLGSQSMKSHPKIGIDYSYESIGNVGIEELSFCLNKVVKRGLEIHYVPHLENIRNISTSDKNEWRIKSGIPIVSLEAHKFIYGKMLQYLSSFKTKKEKPKVSFSLGAEIDPMFFSSMSEVRLLIKTIQHWEKKHDLKISLAFHPNGDFSHGWDVPQIKKPKCDDLEYVFNKLDSISPSMYGEHNHLVVDTRGVNIKQTKERFYKKLENKIQSFCPELKIDFQNKKFNFGEFALDLSDKNQNYENFFSDPAIIEITEITPWSEGHWDHLGLGFDKKLSKEFRSIIKCQ